MKIKKEDKCGNCNRFIPLHIKTIRCSDCSRFYHAKCTSTTIKKFQVNQLNNVKWACDKCTLICLPFSSIDDDNFKQTLNVLDLKRLKINFMYYLVVMYGYY